MAGSGRRVAAGLVLAIGSIAAAANAQEPEGLRIVLTIRNSENVTPDVLTVARERVKRLYERAGIRVDWHQDYAPVPAGRLRIVVVVGSKLPFDAVDEDALGLAAVETDGRGSVVYAFWHRILERATNWRETASTLLGYVIAHEVGHLLLPRTPHSTSGVMRASWSQRDLNEAQRGVLHFTDEQAAQMRHRIARHLFP